MNLLEMKIGRDAESGKLFFNVIGKKVLAGDADSVPKSVSREHLLLTVTDQGMVILKNANIENDLYVNNYAVESKRVAHGDRIELGADRYQLKWDVLDKFFTLEDIRPLEQVWKNYEAQDMQLTIKERRFGVLRSATGIISPVAMFLGLRELGGGTADMLRSALYVVLIAVTLVFFIIAWKLASRIPLLKQQLKEETRQRYRCRQCGSLFNLQSYEQLKQMKKCPHCGAFFIK